MKPLTTSQQRVVDVMRCGIYMQTPNYVKSYYVIGLGSVKQSTFTAMFNNKVIKYSHNKCGFTFYTLSPEYI